LAGGPIDPTYSLDFIESVDYDAILEEELRYFQSNCFWMLINFILEILHSDKKPLKLPFVGGEHIELSK
jgi:hypothetical protein